MSEEERLWKSRDMCIEVHVCVCIYLSLSGQGNGVEVPCNHASRSNGGAE